MKNRLSCFCLLFALGGFSYGLIEMLWRRHTHWSMVITGGLCFTVLYRILRGLGACSLVFKCLIGSTVITIAEFFSGFVFNHCMKLCVWDYSGHRLNFCGQICPLYSFFWALLMIPIDRICRFLDRILQK